MRPRKPRGRAFGRKRKKRRVVRVPRTLSAFPQKMKVKMDYQDDFSTNLASFESQSFRGNSIFDPDSTGVGHQPYLHDTWALIYSKYKVTGCKIWVTAVIDENTNAGRAESMILSLGAFKLITDTPTTIFKAQELPNTKTIYYSAGTAKTVSMFKSSKQMLPTGHDDLQSAAFFGANPSVTWFFNIVGDTHSGTGVPKTWHVKLRYFVELSSPITQAQS